MYHFKKCRSALVSSMALMAAISLPGMFAADAQQSQTTARLTTPQGVRLLQNKSFDDSEQARKEILTLYKDLRLTDVLDARERESGFHPLPHASLLGQSRSAR